MSSTVPDASSYNPKKMMWALSILLLIGMLGFSIMFFVLNKNINPLDSTNDVEALKQRFVWRKRGDIWLTVFHALYLLGNAVILYLMIFNKISISVKNWSLYFLSHLVLLLASTLPFGLLNRYFIYDYLLPAASIAFSLAVLFIIGLVVMRINKRKASQQA